MVDALIPTSRLDYLRITGNATVTKLTEESGYQQYEIHVIDNSAEDHAYADAVAAAAAIEAISVSAADATEKANAAEMTAIATASADATTKANAAQSNAIAAASTDATTKANAAQANAIAAASTDATTKANAAQATAIATASADATAKANAAQANAIATASADATTKANAAQAAATNADRIQISGISQAVGTVLTAGNFSTATRFFVDRTSMTLLGVRFWWPGGASRTIKVSAWDASGTRLANTTVAVSAAGFYQATFGSAVALTMAVIYRISLWDNSGVSYIKTTSALANAMVPARAFYAGTGLYYEAITYFGAGDVFPNSTGAEAYLMDPILST